MCAEHESKHDASIYRSLPSIVVTVYKEQVALLDWVIRELEKD